MANPGYWVRRLRRTRQHQRAADSRRSNFTTYEPAYRDLLVTLYQCGGDDATDELGRWLLVTTKSEGALPAPGRARRRAREICADRELEPSSDSPLAP